MTFETAPTHRDGTHLHLLLFRHRLSWGTHVNTWKQAWRCVSHTPRSNLGLIIDSFNSLAREYADPYNPNGTGLQRSPSASATFLAAHLQELSRTVPGNKIFLFQVADAARPPPGSVFSKPPSDPSVPRLQPWSRNFRLFPLETDRGSFLPVDLYSQTVLKMGYQGDLSLEVFNASLSEKGDKVPEEHALRGYRGLEKLVKAVDGKLHLSPHASGSTLDTTRPPDLNATSPSPALHAPTPTSLRSEKLSLASNLDELFSIKSGQFREAVRPPTPNSPRLGKRIPLAEL